MTSSRKYEKFLNVRTVEKLSEELRKSFLGKKKQKYGVLGTQCVFVQGGKKTDGHGLSCTHCSSSCDFYGVG